jgi:N-acetylglucosaminyl-diphospho-decaprenol L-rhamnosyltransferase
VTLDVEVMIVSYASASVLAPCLRSIADTVPEARVAIREHAGDVAEYHRLQELADEAGVTARIEHDPSNPGFAAGCNALADASDAGWFLFLNPDAQVRSWPFDARPPTGPAVIGPQYTSDASDHSGRSYRIRDEIARSWFRRPGRLPDGRGFVSGAALLVDAVSFRTIGGFDEGFFLFYEDIDFCLRANDAGIPTHVDPAWVVHHDRGHSTSGRRGDALRWSYESACRFHAGRGSPVRAYRWYVVTDALLRAGLHLVRGDRSTAGAYLALARRAVSDSVRRPWSRRRGRDRPSAARARRS